MYCKISTFLTVVLLIWSAFAIGATAVPCPGCRNNGCLPGSSICSSRCIKGYFTQNPYDSPCQKCPSTCKSCTSLTTCRDCIDGRWGDTCNKYCPTNCRACISSQNCAHCIDGYFGETCTRRCPYVCKACTNSGQCTKCLEGFWGDHCQQKCSNGCHGDICDIYFGGCTSCKSGYFLTFDNNIGPTCTKCTIPKCHQCVERNRCKKCEIGWFGASCNQMCSEGCRNKSCLTNGDCFCKNGYFKIYKMGRFFHCHECPNRCTKCESSTHCNECKPGYWGQNCSKKCSQSCSYLFCNQSNGKCNCENGLISLENGTCIDCNKTCANCISGPACTECRDGGVCHESDQERSSAEIIVLATVGVVGTMYFIIIVVAWILLAKKWMKQGTSGTEPEQNVYHEANDRNIKMTSSEQNMYHEADDTHINMASSDQNVYHEVDDRNINMKSHEGSEPLPHGTAQDTNYSSIEEEL